ncbi:conserved hypothetical protein [Candidatus Methylobacter favarea]|uniref:Uncharacterized protein n=1 Tax=Candidatus Methylobacter favarea TaxID=2707345 RepID=A0A8S0WJK9_9GAMM|nr:hypothetical protein [Candidatus Methylobacter favarea]CAA9891396.1 conserved hypothetical protein [Candidatus Methylobacter favarea]
MKSFFVSALVACVVDYSAVLILIDAPVPAEYWVAEMITIKKNLVKEYAGKRKIIVAGGSSTLFGINAEHASEQLDMPVINFGLHAGLNLEKILQVVSAVVEPGDFLILPLEPGYYGCNTKMNSWQVANIVGWDHDTLKEMSYLEKSEFISLVSPSLLGQMFVAKILREFYPAIISERLNALENSLVLAKFRVRPMPAVFEYSAYNLNNHGDMLRTEGCRFKGQGIDVNNPSHVCEKTAGQLINFVHTMRKKGVQVYFANIPYIASKAGLDTLRRGESSFRNEFAHIGCIIDKRKDLIFDRKYFFNTNLHLNAEGRSLRTNLFLKAIRRNVLSGTCWR